MANKVTFDYSKAVGFVQDNENGIYERACGTGKREACGKRAEQEMISLDGSIFRLIMIKVEFGRSRKQQKRLEKIQKYFL